MKAVKKAPSVKEGFDIDLSAVARVAEKVSLQEIYLLEAKIKSDPQDRDPRNASLELSFGSELLPQESEDNLVVQCNFLVAAFHEDDPGKIFMSIEAAFIVDYLLDSSKEFDQNDLEMFARINPIYNTWPYWREFVQNLTTRMGFPALKIPLFKITHPDRPESKAKIKGKSQKPKRSKKKPNAAEV